MPTKTTPAKAAPAKATPAKKPTKRVPKLARYIIATGALADAMKEFQKQLKTIDSGRKVDLVAFDKAVTALNKTGDTFDLLSDKYEEAIFTYLEAQED